MELESFINGQIDFSHPVASFFRWKKRPLQIEPKQLYDTTNKWNRHHGDTSCTVNKAAHIYSKTQRMALYGSEI